MSGGNRKFPVKLLQNSREATTMTPIERNGSVGLLGGCKKVFGGKMLKERRAIPTVGVSATVG
jgi:hypothetical protein